MTIAIIFSNTNSVQAGNLRVAMVKGTRNAVDLGLNRARFDGVFAFVGIMNLENLFIGEVLQPATEDQVGILRPTKVFLEAASRRYYFTTEACPNKLSPPKRATVVFVPAHSHARRKGRSMPQAVSVDIL